MGKTRDENLNIRGSSQLFVSKHEEQNVSLYVSVKAVPVDLKVRPANGWRQPCRNSPCASFQG